MKKIILLALGAVIMAGCAEKKKSYIVTTIDTFGVVHHDTVQYCGSDDENCETCKE